MTRTHHHTIDWDKHMDSTTHTIHKYWVDSSIMRLARTDTNTALCTAASMQAKSWSGSDWEIRGPANHSRARLTKHDTQCNYPTLRDTRNSAPPPHAHARTPQLAEGTTGRETILGGSNEREGLTWRHKTLSNDQDPDKTQDCSQRALATSTGRMTLRTFPSILWWGAPNALVNLSLSDYTLMQISDYSQIIIGPNVHHDT